jgi:hypothetical protein
MTPADQVVSALEARGLLVRGGVEHGWQAQCPVHDDRKASLSMKVGDDGRVLLHCHAGCPTEEIVAALGLQWTDLFSESRRETEWGGPGRTRGGVNGRRSRSTSESVRRLVDAEQIAEWSSALLGDRRLLDRLAELRGWTLDVLHAHGVGWDGERIVIPVTDSSGVLVGVQRYLPNAERRGEQSKMLSLSGSKRELFPAPERIEGGPLWLVEGEPDALTLLSLGLYAVAVPGADGWREDWAARFRGHDVLVAFDCDEPGRSLAARVCRDLLSCGAASVRIIDLDVSRSDGYDVGDLVRETMAAKAADGPSRARRRLERLAESVVAVAPPEPEDGADLLDDLAAFVRRFVVLSAEQASAIALWVVHTHAIEAADSTPYLAVTSAEKRSGKTRLLEVLYELAARARATANTSDAALFRAVTQHKPSLLFDEVDAIFGPKARDREDLRGMLNAGHRRGAKVSRCGGQNMTELQDFDVFCPKVLAGIGELPDTIADRSIPIRLQRKAPGEQVERVRHRDLEADAAPLRESVAAWARGYTDALRIARPKLPDELDDRAQDGAEPLLAIADLAGGEWPHRARSALVALCAGRQAPDDDSLGVRLLADIRVAFDSGKTDRLRTDRLLELLAADDEAPWASWKGSGLTPRSLATLLKPYAIRSRTIRLADDSTPKGYHREQFEDAFGRYLSSKPGSIRHNATTPMNTEHSAVSYPPQDWRVAYSREPENPDEHWDVADVADRSRENGRNVAPQVPGGTHGNGSGNSDGLTVADLADDELLAIFPDSTLIARGDLESAAPSHGKQSEVL